ncbi:unnamed protein product [Fusarium graminearum]|uniref:Uncharacterized protein n=1 Tax=Gibberella zeae TaxID=5518 RepID=A0A4E9EP07_GIBZA|nr:unnamed protein product [Fusarium graminearum]CAF3594635.1 unnamed protein product [Fusarium graminearum]CAF3597472.1 unnamed protein product [Fusarium graminearum]CAG1984119.1 unnamed protein product [Fusarium graminearum]CAG2003303.1 unnamed protein product [Fusarium graminearum]
MFVPTPLSETHPNCDCDYDCKLVQDQQCMCRQEASTIYLQLWTGLNNPGQSWRMSLSVSMIRSVTEEKEFDLG